MYGPRQSIGALFEHIRGVHKPVVSRVEQRFLWMVLETDGGDRYIAVARAFTKQGEYFASFHTEIEEAPFFGAPLRMYEAAPLPMNADALRWRRADHWYKKRMEDIDNFTDDAYVEGGGRFLYVVGEKDGRYLLRRQNSNRLYSSTKARVRRWVNSMAIKEMRYGG